MLTFDEAKHEYRYGAQVVQSVTQCLSKLHNFNMVPADVLEAACERGTIVHTLCQYHDECDLEAASIGDYWPYLDAWIEFMGDYGAVWTGIEERGYSTRYGYAGTLDRRGTLVKLPGKWVIDIKTGAQLHRVCGMQLAAYRQLLAENVDSMWAMARRATVQLSKDGKYKFIEWTSPSDWPAFSALLTLNHWSMQ